MFHRVDDPYALPGPVYFSRAARLGAYEGVIAARIAKIREDENKGHGGKPGEQVKRVSDEVALAQLDDNSGWLERG